MSAKKSNPPEALASKPGKNDFLIVGIGASAGGIQALHEFFQHVPANSGMAYVVILHLSPDHDSQLADLLRLSAKIPVSLVNTKEKVQKDHVYVIPPNQHLEMIDGYISVSANLSDEDRRAPIDIFFRTLAETSGPRAVSVILSGTGANGSMGLKRVKENGGAVFVQNPREAEYNEMPRNAIATELVDEVLPVADIPEKIIGYKGSLNTIHIPVEAENRPQAQQQALREIFSQLRLRTGHDFSNYKRPTLLRRIERRVNIHNLPDLTAYVAYINQKPDEVTALLKDLLISVTNFYRDKKAFEAVDNEIIPRLIESKNAQEQLRIWVAGCATGEEAYSLAMICAERTLGVIDAPKIQIFATDIDEAAIAHAREGYYTLNDAADIPPERLRRFFTKEGDGFRVRSEIREMILFAIHNFIKDPPFSHLDLVSCRNVLIYLNHAAQERVMETFHFALRPGGYLFLGSSESATGSADLYTLFSREHHIYQSRPLALHSYPLPESIPNFQIKQPSVTYETAERENRALERITVSDLHQRLLEQYAPPSVVVNEEYEIVHLSERAGRYLQISGGEPSQNLLKLILPELRLELRSALYQAAQRQSPVEARGLKVATGDHTETINIHVRPVFREGDSAKGFVLVLFEQTADEAEKKEVVLSSDEPVARQLEEELMRVKAQLRASIEQHEFHAEELKASNEELQAMNEELRSAAEELETSKEELQSINEELRTVNQELKVKIEETTLANNNLQNLINSVNIATIFLDRSFRLALFTPSARNLFNLIPADIGRPLSDITHKLDYNQISEDAELVLEKLQDLEREVQAKNGRLFMMRVLPYRTAEDHINGVVLTFFDITERKRVEESLRISEARQVFLLRLSDVLRPLNKAGEIQAAACRILAEQLEADRVYFGELKDTKGNILIQSDYMSPHLESLSGEYSFNGIKDAPGAGGIHRPLVINDINNQPALAPEISDFYRAHNIQAAVIIPMVKNGWLSATLNVGVSSPRYWKDEEVVLMQEVADRTMVAVDRAVSEEALRLSEERFRAIVNQSAAGIYRSNLEGELLFVNRKLCEMLRYTEQELTGRYLWDLLQMDDLEAHKALFRKNMEENRPMGAEKCMIRKDGSIIWVNISIAPIGDPEGTPHSTVAVVLDITERKALEQQKEDFIGIASHELKTPVTSIKAYTEVLQEMFEEAGDEQSAGLMKKLDVQVDRLTGLLHALLDTTKISEGKLPLYIEEFDLNQLISENAEEWQRLSQKHLLVLHPGKILPVRADREHIRQVLTNLVSNAVKYSPAGGEVIITTIAAGNGIQVSVQDFGIGIPHELKEKVFDRFFRVSNPDTHTFHGMGLGLYITAGIIKRHGGTVRVESKQGHGTTFYFTIPYNYAHTQEPEI